MFHNLKKKMKKILLITILSITAFCSPAQEPFDSVSYAFGDGIIRRFLASPESQGIELDSAGFDELKRGFYANLPYEGVVVDSIGKLNLTIGLLQAVFFSDSWENGGHKDEIPLECILSGMRKVARGELGLPQDTTGFRGYFKSIGDPLKIPQDQRCTYYTRNGIMRALTCNLQEFIKDQYGMEEDIMPADRRFFAAGYAIMLESIIMSEADSLTQMTPYALGGYLTSSLITRLPFSFHTADFIDGCKAAAGLCERKLSIAQCDEITNVTINKGQDGVDDEPKVVTEVRDLNDDERLSLDCNKKLPKDCEVRVYSALSHEELATYINNTRELSKLYSSTGYFSASDTTKMNRLFKKIKLPKNVKTMWLKPWDTKDSFEPLCYYNTPLIKTNGTIESVEIDKNSAGLFSIILKLNDEKQWEQVTEQNIGKRLAFEINGHVLYAPTVHQTITGGRTAVHLTKELLKSIFPLLQVQEK